MLYEKWPGLHAQKIEDVENGARRFREQLGISEYGSVDGQKKRGKNSLGREKIQTYLGGKKQHVKKANWGKLEL